MAEVNYASNGKGNLGVTLGAIGTGLGVLGGALGMGTGLFNNSSRCPEDHVVTRYDADKDAQIASLQQTISLKESEQYTDQKMIDVYERISTRILANERSYADDKAAQQVINAQLASNIAVDQTNIASLQNTLGNLTKTIIPITNVCPEPMKLYNSWTAPTTA